MRCEQYLELLNPGLQLNKERSQANAWEFAAGLHWWLRQISIHAGFYRFWAAQKATTALATRPDDAMAQALAGAAPPSGAGAEIRKLEGIDIIKHAIINLTGLSNQAPLSTGAMREKLLGRFRKVKGLAEQVQKAAEELTQSGVLKAADEAAHKKPGRKVLQYQRPDWEEIANSQSAEAEVKRLLLGRGNFD